MSEHPYALTLSLLIHAEGLHQAGHDGFDDSVAVAIERYLVARGFSEERRADLYARIVEAVPQGCTHADLRRACSAALTANEGVT